MAITASFKNAMEHDGEYVPPESAHADWEAFGRDAFTYGAAAEALKNGAASGQSGQAVTAQADGRLSADEKEKKERNSALNSQIQQALLDQQREFDAMVHAIDERIAGLEDQSAKNQGEIEQLEARQKLRKMIDDGKLDPSNPQHAALMQAAGFEPDTPLDQVESELDDTQHNDLTELERLYGEQEAIERQMEALKRERLNIIEAEKRGEPLTDEEMQALRDRLAAQGVEVTGVDNIEYALNKSQNQLNKEKAEVDQDIEAGEFMKALADLDRQDITAQERSAAIIAEIDKLSGEVREQLAQSPDTAELFTVESLVTKEVASEQGTTNNVVVVPNVPPPMWQS